MLRSLAIPIIYLHYLAGILAALSVPRKSLSLNSTQCRCAPEETFVPSLNSGVFKSPGFPTSFVGAMLDYFETEHRNDVLEVYQTRWNGSMVLAKQAVLHGSFDPRTMERQFFSSVGGGLEFRFISDNTDSDYHGFKISFRRYPKNDRSNAPCPMPFQYASSQIQTFPVISPNFHTDSSCIFTINSNDAINLTITQFRSSTLSLKIYETENFQVRSPQHERPLARIQPGIVPSLPLSVISRTSSLTVLLSTMSTPFSDYSAIHYGKAYEFQFSETRSLCACPASELVISRVHPTTVTSPGYPLEYCDSANCTINVALEGPRQKGGSLVEVLRMTVQDFQTEPDLDYINFWDADGRPMLLLSYEARNIRHLTFDRPRFTFSFITDHSIVDIGFNISIEAYKKERDCICPTLTRNLIEGRSHYEENSFEKRKCQFMDCFWFINVPTSSNADAYHRIVLKINHTITGQSDFIIIAQGAQTERNPFTKKLNSLSSGAEVTFEFEGVEPVTIWFHRESPTDEQLPEAPEEKSRLELNFGCEWREVCQCGAEQFQAEVLKWQPLRSPDFPSTYCRNMQCQWTLSAPEGFHILLNVSSFVTEADQDFLYIFEGNDTTQKHKEILTGPLYGSSLVHSEQNVMTLLFISDGSIQADGFELWFRAEPNPGTEMVKGFGYFPKTLVFFLFFLLASIGVIFLLTRTQRIDTRNGLVTNIFEDGIVRFSRRLNFGRHTSDQSFSTSTSINNNISSASNPLFHP
uniref:CUB domain-containing protein n=1 Tax=Globodera rostochiensis TaxID=31243 RepID=A0A914HHZ9_GLORO